MEEIINKIISNKLLVLGTAIIIVIIFRILASIIAYIIIKMFNLKKKIDIRKNPYYRPLKTFIIVLGIYLAILFVKEPLQINEKAMNIITKIFKITIIVLISKGLINGLSSPNSFIIKWQKKMTQDGINTTTSIVILKILKILVYIGATVIIIQEMNYDLSGLITGLGLSGVILTLAAQDTAKNLFGGIVIFLDKPFKVGDYIKLPEYDGTVEDITFRSTKVRTVENTVLHIPNSEISSAIITNCSEMQKRRYKTDLIIELGTPLMQIQKVIQDIEDMLSVHEKVISDSINVKFQNITDNGTEIIVIAYLDIVDYMKFLEKQQELNFSIMQILEDNGVELAYNTQTIHIKNNNN